MTCAINCSRRLMRRLIHEPLAADLAQSGVSALVVSDSKASTVRMTESELFAVALKVRFADVVIGADQAALEKAEEAFDAVGMDFPAHIFLSKVIDHRVLLEGAARHIAPVRSGVSEKLGVLGDLGLKDRLQGFTVNVGNVEGASGTVTLDQREDFVLVAGETLFDDAPIASTALDGPVVSLVGFDDLPAAAHDAAVRLHRLADTVGHEPRGLVGHAKSSVELVAAHALFAGAEQEHGLKPDVELDLGLLKDGAYGHAELLTASVALPQAGAGGLPLKSVVVANDPAVGADRAVRPAHPLQVLAGSFGVLEVGLVKCAHG